MLVSSIFDNTTDDSGDTWGVRLSLASFQREVTAHGSQEIQDAKNRHLPTIAQLCRAISSQQRHVSTIGKKPVKQQYLFHMSLQ